MRLLKLLGLEMISYAFFLHSSFRAVSFFSACLCLLIYADILWLALLPSPITQPLSSQSMLFLLLPVRLPGAQVHASMVRWLADKNLTKHFLANTWPFFMGFISFELLFIAAQTANWSQRPQ